MSACAGPRDRDYVVLSSNEGGLARLMLARVAPDGACFAVITTFASVGGAQQRLEDEARARAQREGVRAFRREDDGAHTLLFPPSADDPSQPR